MNENVRVLLERDQIDCKQKCLTGYLTRNKSLFQNHLPALTSRCCCRHLEERKKHKDLLKTSSAPSRDACIKNRNITRPESHSHRGKYPCSNNVLELQSSPGKRQHLKVHPAGSVDSGPSDKGAHFSSDLNRDHDTRRKRQLTSDLAMNANLMEKRVPNNFILLTTSVNSESKEVDGAMKTDFQTSLLPSLENKKSTFSDCKRSTVQGSYPSLDPTKLICYSDNDDCIKDEKFLAAQQGPVLSSDVNYDHNVTLQDLMDFNMAYFC